MKCAICNREIKPGSNYYAKGPLGLEAERVHARCLYVEEGRQAERADIAAGLRALADSNTSAMLLGRLAHQIECGDLDNFIAKQKGGK